VIAERRDPRGNGLLRRLRGATTAWRLAVAALLLLAVPGWPRPAGAQDGTGAEVEIDLGRFVILCPPEVEAALRVFAAEQRAALDAAYDVLVPLYGATPVLPIIIRVYASSFEFANLNAIVPPLGPGAVHTHLGSREIALILPFPPGYLSSPDAVNALRHELSGLLLSTLSANQMPPGLELGFNQYVEVPGAQTEFAIERLRTAAQYGSYGQLLPWRNLFEGDGVYTDRNVAYPEALSIAAFLIETYGYDRVRALAQSFAQGRSYSTALAEVYGEPLDRLQQAWLAYLPRYMEERWQYNALHNFDLRPYQTGLEAGAYAQVGAALEEVIPLLTLSQQSEALAEAQLLSAWAAEGVAAEALVQAQRQALLAGDYQRVLELAEAAQAAYGALGDTRRVHEIQDHIERAQGILDLRAELAAAEDLIAAGDYAAGEARLRDLVPRFDSLGDTTGGQLARSALAGLGDERQQAAAERIDLAQRLLLAATGLAALAGLQAVLGRVWARRRPAPEIL
jgi:hypothetical protein